MGLLFIMLMFTVVEMDRLFLVTCALAEGARAGLRYAVVHGSDNAATTDDIKGVVKDFASTAIIDKTLLNTTVTYSACDSDPGNGCATSPYTAPGGKVNISVTYPYDPFTNYFPLSVTLGSSAQGVIAY